MTVAVDDAKGGLETEKRGAEGPLSRRSLVWIWLGVTAVVLLQSKGLIVRDTELGVDVAPLQWMASSLHLWNPSAYSGSVQIEMFGYLIPMAPFFVIGQILHVPVWLTERFWLSSLLTVGIWGVVRVVEELGPSRKWARLLGGIAYVTTPIVIDWSILSVNVLSVVLLPWVLLPLIKGSRGGSTRRMAARSGVAVALMGGVNATVILAALPLSALWLVTRSPGQRRRSLSFWWVVALGLACFWWLAGAALQGKYGYNYLPYTETAVNTTSTASLFESLRGTSDWLNYFQLGTGAKQPGAFTLVSSWLAILGTAVVTGLGLAGLSLRRTSERVFLIGGVAVGVVVMASGYHGAGSGAFTAAVLSLLTQPFLFLRNISKFSPDVAFPVTIGLIWLASRAHDSLSSHKEPGSPRRVLPVLIVGAAIAGTLAAGLPILRGQLYPDGGFSALPSYWSQAASWLDSHQGRQTTLLVPGSPFGTYRWGNPQDEPLSVLAGTSVTSRSIVPFGSNGNTQMLSVVEGIIDSGTPQPGLAQYLARSGIDYLVERNNLDVSATGAPHAAVVHQVLSETPGLVRVATFGPYVSTRLSKDGVLPVFAHGQPPSLRALEVYKVVPKVTEVRTTPAASPVVVSGTPSSLVSLAAAGVLNGRAAVLAKDPSSSVAVAKRGATWALTDGNQRRVLKYGKIHDNASYLLGATQVLRSGNSVGVLALGYGSAGGVRSQTTSSPIGVSQLGYSAVRRHFAVGSFTASSFGPSSAFDNNPETAWIPNLGPSEAGESVGVRLSRPTAVHRIAITPLVDGPRRSQITSVTVHTDAGKMTSTLPVRAGTYWVPTPSGKTSEVWVTIASVRLGTGPKDSLLGPGIVQVTIPGVTYRPAMSLPTDELASFSLAGRPAPILSFDDPVSNLNFDFSIPQTTPAPWTRKMVLPHSTLAHLGGAAVANTTPALASLVDDLLTPPGVTLKVSASSTLRDLPNFRATNLIEASSQPWIAGLGEKHPTVHLTWGSPRTVDVLKVGLTTAASRPTSLLVTDGSSRQVVSVPRAGGMIPLAPMTTDHLDVTVEASVPRWSVLPAGSALAEGYFEYATLLPPGLKSLQVPAVDPTLATPVRASSVLHLPCGDGPMIKVNGTLLSSSVVGTLGALSSFAPVHYETCGVARLAKGPNVIAFPQRSAFRMASMTALPVTRTSSTPLARQARVISWGNSNREVSLSRGPATFLQVSQNINTGWVATFHGQALKPITLEGWQQAWVVPAGAAGTVTMTFEPDRTFQMALLIGLLFLLLLGAAALWAKGGSRSSALGTRRPYPTWLALGLSSLAILAVSRDDFVLFIPLLVIAWWRRGTNTMAAVAAVAFIVAGLDVARHPETDFLKSNGAFSMGAQLLSVVALGAVLSAAIVAEHLRGRGSSEPEDPSVTDDAA